MVVRTSFYNRDQLANLARLELESRGRRRDALGGGAVSDPEWAMLLDLYVAEQSRAKIQTTNLIEESGVPRATGLRLIAHLSELRLLTRSTSELDKRSKFVELTDKGRELLEQYLAKSLNDLETGLD